MMDLFDAPAAVPVVSTGFMGPRWPTASLGCDCGARDEVAEPCPDALNCWGCKRGGGLVRYAPRFLPPPAAGRKLTAAEAARFSRDIPA